MRRIADTRGIVTTLIAVLAAVAFWGAAWRQMNDTVLTRVPVLDEAHYLRAAHALADSGFVAAEPFYMSPLYTWLTAAVGSGRAVDDSGLLVGPAPWGVRVLQALLWLGTAWLLLLLGRGLFGPRWGWAPPLLWAGYLPAAVLAGQVLMEVPLTFLATAALALATGRLGPPAPLRRALLVGLCVGAATLLRGTAVVLLVPAAAALAREVGAGRALRRCVPAAAVAALLVVLPAVLHNSILTGGLRGPSLNGGINLYIGNWSGANGFFFSFVGFDMERDPGGVAFLEARTGERVAGLAEADARWAALAREAVAEDPGRALGLWARKIWLHVVGVEIPQISALSAWTRHVAVFRALIVPYALLSALGLAGAVWLWRRRPELRVWTLAVLAMIAVQSLFFVTTRYRLILTPAWILLGTGFVREVARLRGRALAPAAMLLAAAALAVAPWGLGRTRELFAASGLENEAVRWYHVAEASLTSDPERARDALGRSAELAAASLAADSTRGAPWTALARTSWLGEDPERAMALLKQGLGRVRERGALLDLLIRMQLEEGRPGEAIPYLDAALKERPGDPEMLHLMVAACLRHAAEGRGREGRSVLAAAERAARRAVTLAPGSAAAHLDLGVVLANLGRPDEALEVLERGRILAGNDPVLARNLDDLRARVASSFEGGEVPAQD